MRRKREEEKQHDLESVKGIIVKLAMQSWHRLPSRDKIWIEPDDLIQDSLLFICKLRDSWKPSRRASWSSYCYFCLQNHLRKYLKFRLMEFRTPVQLGELKPIFYPQSATLVEAVETYNKIYRYASEDLRKLLAWWIGTPAGYEKLPVDRRAYRVKGESFERLKDELWGIVGEINLSFRPNHVRLLQEVFALKSV